MPASDAAECAPIRRLLALTRTDTGQHRGAGGVSSGRRSAAAGGGLNRTSAWAGDINGGGPARQPGRHRRVPWTQVGRWPGRHFGAAGRFLATPAGKTDAAVIQTAGPARGARTGR